MFKQIDYQERQDSLRTSDFGVPDRFKSCKESSTCILNRDWQFALEQQEDYFIEMMLLCSVMDLLANIFPKIIEK